MNLENIRRKFDLTADRVRQIKDKTITKLREAKTFNLLRS
jgi:RNA polymerase primary sigma factor